jgi:MarR-like DNA-binding transcriptional regulator SgrR of sgrS sRNA
MKISDKSCVFKIEKLLKTSKPGKHLSRIELLAYSPEKALCIVEYLKLYLERTESLRENNTQLLISYQKPYGPVTTDTIARWIKQVLAEAGIDTSIFTAHSTRAASTSAAKTKQIPIDTILTAAGWSNESTFARFYNKPIRDDDNYGHRLLNAIFEK